ncbi:ABC transporter ATP-binding protein/permease, partial [Candidatus Parcubacteria bacterium]|nr:ABC transporter ATP-binding protein/permease [Candidatus Parcubacteria bacterium]
FFEDPEFYDRYEMVRRYSMSRPINLLWALSDIFSELIGMGTFLFVAIRFNPLITAGFLLLSLPGVFFDLFFARRFYSLSDSRTPENRKAWYLSHLLFSDRSVKEIKIFGLAPLFIKRFKKISLDHYNETKTLILKRDFYNTLLSFLGNISYYLVFFYLVVKALQQRITLGDFTFYRTAFNNIDRGFATILQSLTRIYESNLYLEDLLKFLNLEPDTFEIVKGKRTNLSQINLELKNISFKYPGTDKEVLKNINLTVEPGKSIALVGENGAGKTTLIKLICGFYEPTKGRILVNGHDLTKLNKKEYRKHIGVIFQDFTAFDLTAKENIGLGEVSEINNLAKIKKAAQKAGADKIIEKLPERYDTMLGRQFKGGVQLSSGEWQKIALARAFATDAALLILDEPTAAVDAKTEYQIFRKFEKMTREKSVILISHRFSTARIADRIVVIHQGRIAEEGTHQELLAAGGKYAELFSLQAEGYR